MTSARIPQAQGAAPCEPAADGRKMSCRRYARPPLHSLSQQLLPFAGFSLRDGSRTRCQLRRIGRLSRRSEPGQVGAFGPGSARAPNYALDFFAGDTWALIESPDWWLNAWQGSPLLRRVLGARSSRRPVAPCRKGAAGAYNSHFQKLAQTLVAHGQGNAILRLGWEFNGSWYAWYAGKDPAAFAAYWRQIVDTMRAVSPGLRFDWNPTLGTAGMSTGVEAAYPGDAYVDYIGTDVYDQSWGSNYTDPAFRWNEFVTQKNGLNWVASFAAAHGKPITIPEWGLSIRADGHGGGDNAYFIQHMYDWITSHNVAFDMYFEFDASDGAHRLMTAQFPIGSAAYRRLFAGAAPAPTPPSSSSSSTAASTTSTSTPTSASSPSTTTTSTTSPKKQPPPTCKGKRCERTVSRTAQADGGSAVAAKSGHKACLRWRVASRPPTWFWTWVRWRLGRSEFRGRAGASAYRPAAVPRKIPPAAWRQYRRFAQGKSVAIRICVR